MITIEEMRKTEKIAAGQKYVSGEGVFFGNNPLPPVYPVFTVASIRPDGSFNLTYIVNPVKIPDMIYWVNI